MCLPAKFPAKFCPLFKMSTSPNIELEFLKDLTMKYMSTLSLCHAPVNLQKPCGPTLLEHRMGANEEEKIRGISHGLRSKTLREDTGSKCSTNCITASSTS